VSSKPPHQALYRRWRAQTFGQIVGQQAVVQTLLNAVRSGRVSHAYLFVGPRGTGKTSMARILAKAINCTDPREGEPCDVCPSCVAIRDGRALDVTEMDAASNNRVDDMRDLLPRIFTTPSDLKRKVFIIDEVQRIKEGWDVLLKTLEEPPDHVVFVFCTTDLTQIRPAVLSRVQRFDFRRLTVQEIAGKLRTILAADDRVAEPAAIDLIARQAAGGMRDAESMLDQLIAVDAGPLSADRVREVLGLVDEETVEAFLQAMLGADALAGIELLDDLQDRGRDLRAFSEQAIERLRAALVASMGRGAPGGLAAAGPNALARAARALASIDPAHAGPGGLRLQLDLVLLAPHTATPALMESEPSRPPVAPTVAVSRPAVQTPSPAVAPTAATALSSAPGPAVHPAESAAAARPAHAAGPDREAPPSAGAADLPAEPRPRPSLDLVVQRWPEIVALVSKSPAAKPLITACRPVSVDGSVVTLGFPEAQSFLKEVAERRRPVLEDGFGRVLGMPVTVRCVPANVEGSTLGADADGARLLSEFRRIFSDDVVDVKDVD
jgi:DNA polymerase-3 subunit gamma/tau